MTKKPTTGRAGGEFVRDTFVAVILAVSLAAIVISIAVIAF